MDSVVAGIRQQFKNCSNFEFMRRIGGVNKFKEVIKMTNYREILRLRSLGINNSQIAASMGISRQTVVTALKKSTAAEIDWQVAEGLSDRKLTVRLFPAGEGKTGYRAPDYEYVHRELAKSGVTLQLLWLEYCDKCRDNGEAPYQLTQFKKYYRDFAVKTKATMHLNHKPGEIMEVDWAGQTAGITDADTGGIIPAYVFVSVLPYSGYAYTEAFLSQDQESWIAAHVNAYGFFGGVSRILVPDNLKTGVIKNTRGEVILNRAYQEMAEHYGTAIIPARPRSPKDKATVEGAVGIISIWVLAAIRNQQFLSLPELNSAIRERLHSFNHKPFQKKDGSRAALFAEEQAFLLPLPSSVFELATWKIATVQYNYHISADGQNYSVPYEYIKQKVDVRLTRNVVEIFFGGCRVCSHVRLYGRAGQYSTAEGHMPSSHQQYAKWDGGRFRAWAAKIGVNTATVIEAILTGYKAEQQGYKACMALLKLSDQYTPARLETACAKALGYTPRPGFKNVQTILKSGLDRIAPANDETEAPVKPSEFSFVRGSDYYGGGRK
jgi:transposase